MSLDDLPPQPKFVTPEGDQYADECLRLSRPVLEKAEPALLDLAYGEDYWQKIDIFVPEGKPAVPLPVLIFAHGGSWIGGYKEWMAFMAPAILAIPAIFVSVSYRLAPTAKCDEMLGDCVDAIGFACERVADLGADMDRIYVGGHSAGGHLMSLATLSPALLAARGISADCIKGCFAVSTPFDVSGDTTTQPDIARIQATILNEPHEAERASPIHCLPGPKVPFHIVVGETDFPRVKLQGPLMRDALLNAGSAVEYHELAGQGHFDTNLRSVEAGSLWIEDVKRILNDGASPAD